MYLCSMCHSGSTRQMHRVIQSLTKGVEKRISTYYINKKAA